MIGIFDSGLGGMTVTRAIEQLCPGYPLLYFGDLIHTPYGSKSCEALTEYAIRNTEFLIAQGAALIVIACNSAASIAGNALRNKFSIPIIDVIEPAVNQAISTSKNGTIGVIGTQATIKSDVYAKNILARCPNYRVYSQACPLLVPLVEEGWLNRKETKMISKKYLQPLRCKQVDTLILGCTHYPMLKSIIQPRIGKRVKIVDSSIETALFLQNFLLQNKGIAKELAAQKANNRFFVSDLPLPTQSLAESIFGRPVHLEKVHA